VNVLSGLPQTAVGVTSVVRISPVVSGLGLVGKRSGSGRLGCFDIPPEWDVHPYLRDTVVVKIRSKELWCKAFAKYGSPTLIKIVACRLCDGFRL
jgi:hypothetical protein